MFIFCISIVGHNSSAQGQPFLGGHIVLRGTPNVLRVTPRPEGSMASTGVTPLPILKKNNPPPHSEGKNILFTATRNLDVQAWVDILEIANLWLISPSLLCS